MATGSRSNLDSLKTTERRGAGQARNVDGVPNPGGVETRLSDILGADDLRAIEALASTGLLARIAANSWALRSLALSAGAEAIASWTNPAGVAGNPELGLDVQAANEVFAGPASGSPAVPAFRALTLADITAALDYAATTFTPTVTFATPGDLSVAYATQTGFYVRIGTLVFVSIALSFTPTHTTASGNVRFSGLPLTVAQVNNIMQADLVTNSVTWPAGTTYLLGLAVNTTNYIELRSEGSGASRASWTVTQFPTGTARAVNLTGVYFTS